MLLAAAYILFVVFALYWFDSNKRREWAALKAIHDFEQLGAGRATDGSDESEQRPTRDARPCEEAVATHGRERNDTARLKRARAVVFERELVGLHVGYIGDDLLLTGRGIQIQGPDERVLHCLRQARDLAELVRLLSAEHEP